MAGPTDSDAAQGENPPPGARSTSGSSFFVSEGEIDALFDAKVAELEKSADGQGLPVEALRHMLTHGYDRSPCHAAMVVMEERGE